MSRQPRDESMRSSSDSRASDGPYLKKIRDLAHNRSDVQPLLQMMTNISRGRDKTRIFHQTEISSSSWEIPSSSTIPPDLVELVKLAPWIDGNKVLGHSINIKFEGLTKMARVLEMDPPQKPWVHINGVLDYKTFANIPDEHSLASYFARDCWKQPKWGIQSNTQISYYYVHEGLYLFLIDPALNVLTSKSAPPTLRCPCSNNRGGMVLPPLFEDGGELLDVCKLFTNAFEHPWRFEIMFQAKIIPGPALIYMLCGSMWEQNIRVLSQTIEDISFNGIPHPENQDYSTKLHQKRKQLAYLKKSVSQTAHYMPQEVIDYFSHHPYYQQITSEGKARSNPAKKLYDILERATELEKFLMESFQLLMATMSVLESHSGLEQATRVNRLTQLAFIYIPLSFVTGVFGMNLKELTGAGPHLWSFFVALAAVVTLTLLVFVLLILRSRKKKGREKKEYQA